MRSFQISVHKIFQRKQHTILQYSSMWQCNIFGGRLNMLELTSEEGGGTGP